MATTPKPMSRTAVIANLVLTAVVFPAVTLGLAGDWRWIEGWIFSLWMVAMIDGNLAYLALRDPALLAERAKRPGSNNQKPWDRALLTAAYILAVVWFVIQPLDARRFGWSPAFPLWLKILGGLMLIPALYLIQRAPMENTYLSTMVRVQEERKQRVITTGVYAFVRHPLYLGCILMLAGAPLMLGSVVGLVISLIAVISLMGRSVAEEKLLASELDGYADYQRKVKYRLLPFVW